MKRRLFKLALFILLGAIVNVAVAWGCAKWSGTNVELSFGSNYEDLGIDPASVSKQAWRFHLSHLASGRNNVSEIFGSGFDFGYEVYIISCREYLISPQYQLVTNALHVGWPAASLAAYSTSYYSEDACKEEVWESGILFVVDHTRWIPVRPIWPGFGINTIFFAMILWLPWLLWSIPFALHRVLRRKRGQCIKCGYDLHYVEHKVCPECGSKVTTAN